MPAEAVAAPAPAAAPSPAPASSPAPAAPASAPAAAPAQATPNFGAGAGVTSHVNPNDFKPGSDDYAKAIFAEQLAAVPVVEEPAKPVDVTVPVAEPVAEVAPAEVVAPDAEIKPQEVKPAEVEEDFQLEPEAIVTPEALSQMVTDNPEFGKLLAADPKLKGQLYKTAREAAELKPYREIFPDLDSAKSASARATTFNDVEQVFRTSTTREGTLATLNKLAELCWERDDNGEPLMENGNPIIGDDLYGFCDNVEMIGLEHRKAEFEERFKANQYHLKPGITQAEVDAAWNLDNTCIAVLDYIMGQVAEAPAGREQLPEYVQQKLAEVDRREKALTERQHGEKVEERSKFEIGLQTEAQTRINDGIGKIIANVEKQGGVVSPYLKNILPKAIGAKLVSKIQANPALQDQMHQLQRLPIGDASRQRRLAAIDRAVQQYLPDIAREELREAGIQIASASKAKLDKINGQAQNTNETEIRGSTGPSGRGGKMDEHAAYDQAKSEWMKANPGKPWDKVAESKSLGRLLQLIS